MMPLVNVPVYKIQDQKQGMQKFYKTNVSDHTRRNATSAATPVKRVPQKLNLSDQEVKLNPTSVQKFLTHIGTAPANSKKKVVTRTHSAKAYDNHVYENVTKLGSCDAKLTKALETFDKILSEFSTPFVPPKLQKAKTCSIIESRCILKKSDSDPKKETPKDSQSKHPPLTKTKSLWNLNDMEDMLPISKIPIPISQTIDNKNKYNTYKISNKDTSQAIGKSEEMVKLDVKTRILRKTLSNPPSAPVPTVGKAVKKVERKVSDPSKKNKPPRIINNKTSSLTKSKTSDNIEVPKNKIQKARSIWEVSKTSPQSNLHKPLARTKSNASISGSLSKIPVVKGYNSPSIKSNAVKASSPAPEDLNRLDLSKESGVGVKKFDTKTYKVDSKSDINEISKVRAKIQQKKMTRASPEANEESKVYEAPLSPVRSIISKMEMHCAIENQAEPIPLQNCKIISPLQKTVGIANMCLQNSYNVLPKKNSKPIETKSDIEICKIAPDGQVLVPGRKLSYSSSKSFASSDEKIYEGHSDYSDDSGHASNESESVVPLKAPLAIRKSDKPDLISNCLKNDEVPVPAERHPQIPEVLLRAGALSCLERARAERLRARITRFQALCRGVLARRALARRRVQEVAVRCIQRNVRAFLTVRDWPWWRLLVRITPLLAVHRTEDQLRAKTEELDTLRVKVEKLETERSSLKHENDKLENKLSEMTAELAVEQAAGSLASERLSAETAERLRLERDLQSAKIANNSLQHSSERLETELMYARAETNGSVASETGEGGAGSDSEGSGDGGRYKRRLQVALRELEAARRQLRQQHEDDLEQLVTLKKQLEKKAADAYEEAEEQRQVAAQWKRKAQKAASDANDVRLLLDEQGAKATILERRQRKFDAECQQVKEEARREKQTRERVQREHEALMAEKCALEQMLSDARLELEMKEEKLSSTQRELDDLTFGGKTEEEVGALKKIKHDLENKCHDQEEELDELAGQVQLLESHKVRLEMSLEQQRKASRLEAAQRDEELEEVRAQAAKKIKTLESQLEMEHNERTLVLRERHELERRLASLEESARADATERDQREQRNRRDLRRYKALARDAQVVLERREQDAGAKAQLRQLRDKLDDAEVALRVAQKARQVAEAELAEAQSFAEEASRGRREAELRATQAQRESASARAQLEEAEEEAADVMKKYRACVASLSEEQRAAKEASAKAAIAEEEARAAQEKAAELMARLASLDNATTVGQAAQHDKLELRTKELEASLELEQTARSRLEAQAARARDAASASAHALGAAQQREITTSEELRKVMRTVRELREELAAAGARCDEATRARGEAENRLEEERSNAAAARADLRATNQRLLLLQQAIADDISPDNGSDSENESVSSDESIETFLANHKLYPTANTNHGSETPRSNDGGRQSRSSNSSKQMSPVKESFA